jgi:hypothetical protein
VNVCHVRLEAINNFKQIRSSTRRPEYIASHSDARRQQIVGNLIVASGIKKNVVTGLTKQLALSIDYNILTARRTRTVTIMDQQDPH